MTATILVRGQPVPVDATVRVDPALQFPALGKRTETRAIVWHWTGGEGGGEQVYRVLRDRGLSVHFAIDQEGIIWQYADADAYCSHASGANGFAVGVEISNRADASTAHAKWPRTAATDTIHGKTARHTRFLPAQIRSAKALAVSLSRAYGLPLVVPPDTTVCGKATLGAFRGHLGHFHLSERKRDPGTEILREIAALGACTSVSDTRY